MLTIEPTEHFFMIDDVMVRAWKAADGTVALVALVAVPRGDNVSPLAELGNLIEIPPPSAAAQQVWAHLVLGQRRENEL